MDVTSITSLPRGKNSDHSLLSDEQTNDKHRAGILRRSLSQLKQNLTKETEQNATNSFDAAAKMALIESYINSGKYFAAEQVLKEITEVKEDLSLKDVDDVYIKEEQIKEDLRVHDDSKIKDVEDKLLDSLTLASLDEEKKEEALRLLSDEVNNQVSQTLSVLQNVISGFYGLSEK